MPDEFISLVKTVGDRERFRQELGKISRSFAISGGVEKTLNEISNDLASFLKGAEITTERIDELQEELSDLKVVGLTLAFAPKTSQIAEIYNWLGTNIGHNLVIDTAVNESLVAGAIIEFNGKYLDGSLSGKLN